jgi:HK97 gp10 family phage protein
MAKAMTITISGVRELNAALGDYSKATARGILERTLKRAAEPIRADAARMAPVESGELRDGIIVEVVRKNAGTLAYADVMRGGGTRAEAALAARNANREAAGKGLSASVSVRSTAWHSHLVEFGTVNTAPQPFLRPAFEGGKGRALTDIKTIMGDELNKAAKRAAARALRLKGKAA